MGKKLEDNGMWEGSRMMLPERREAILDRNRNRDNKGRSDLDENQLQLISEAQHQSMYNKQAVTLTMFDLVEDLQVVGVIERVDGHLRRLKVEGEWFGMDDIVSVDLESLDGSA